jgi:hypothetical protein
VRMTRTVDGAVSTNLVDDVPTTCRATWFGISNWHFQIGGLGILLDAETSFHTLDPTSVELAITAIEASGGTITHLLVGHDHLDHSLHVPEWARATQVHVYGPKSVGERMVDEGIDPSRFTAISGSERFDLGRGVEVRTVRWIHSVKNFGFALDGRNGPETFGFLLSVGANGPTPLHIFITDSGTGGVDLEIPRVEDEVTYGSPLENLHGAVNDAGAKRIDVWLGAPESRLVEQAEVLIPMFSIGTLLPHHFGLHTNEQSGFDLHYGLHYPCDLDDFPQLSAFVKRTSCDLVLPVNYFDAWEFSAEKVVSVDNTQAKACYGLPASGPGPGIQGTNPRRGTLERPDAS